jgi:hypothetical protein
MNRKGLLITIIVLTILITIMMCIFNFTTNYVRIGINENEWNKITSSRQEDKSLKIDELFFNDYRVIIDEDDSKIYYSLINESHLKYNPDISYTLSDKSCKLVALDTPITDELIHSNHEFKMMIYNGTSYRIYSLICTDFPIVSVHYNDQDKNKNKQTGFYIFDNLGQKTNRVTITEGKFRQIDDNTFTLSFMMMSLGNNQRENKISIFNMGPNSNYILEKEESNSQNDKALKVLLFTNDNYQGIFNLSINKKNKEKLDVIEPKENKPVENKDNKELLENNGDNIIDN